MYFFVLHALCATLYFEISYKYIKIRSLVTTYVIVLWQTDVAWYMLVSKFVKIYM